MQECDVFQQGVQYGQVLNHLRVSTSGSNNTNLALHWAPTQQEHPQKQLP